MVVGKLAPDGWLHDLRVSRPMGLGLDERALVAAREWRFEPGSSSLNDDASKPHYAPDRLCSSLQTIAMAPGSSGIPHSPGSFPTDVRHSRLSGGFRD